MLMATALKLAMASLRFRWRLLALTLLTLTLSITLLLGVQYLRSEVRQSFLNTLSGTDLIVGARSSPVNLLLYTVFHMGDPTANIRWDSAQQIAQDKGVAWSVPISLGDSYRGHRVVGTDRGFLEHVRIGRQQALHLNQGDWFEDVFEVVLGAEVARKLQHRIGDDIVLAHGAGPTSFMSHADKPFRVSGVLAPTGTPIDRAVYVSLAGLEAIHLGWEGGVPAPGRRVSAQTARERDLTPKSITALLIGVERKVMTFQLQRRWNTWQTEPLSAILPGVALATLWQTLGQFERILLGIAGLVLITSLVGLLAVLIVIQTTRTREMAVLRAIGAGPGLIASLFVFECVLLAGLASLLAGGLWYAGVALGAGWLLDHWGVAINLRPPDLTEAVLLMAPPVLALLVALVPAILSWRRSVVEGLNQAV